MGRSGFGLNSARKVYTIGHSNRSMSEFLRLLRMFGIRVVYDVRSFPSSRVAPHFSKTILAETLRREGFEYFWDGRLGGYRKFGRDVADLGIAKCFKSEGFRAYATYLTTKREAIEAAEKLAEIAAKKPTAIMCSEKIPWRCHRKIISDLMIAKGFEVIHIIDEDWKAVHKLSKCARIVRGKLVYV